MPADAINITLGTAGHIDHGKTSLVLALTGCDTDRLKEEKERGMSIELGFAPCLIAGLEVGICDVPGHERFIRTMVAGASAIDGVILVVAADDGVMPQTREHMDILTLLGIQHGLVALTKRDRVPPERLEAVQAQVRGFLAGTFLEGAPILPISNVTGEGFDPFLKALSALVKSIRPRRTDGVFRLPVERAFSVRGAGTVVAGVPVSGCARLGDTVVLLPQGVEGRIRGIQIYGRESDTLRAGQCAAVQIPHWDHRTIVRGNAVASLGYFEPRDWYVCSLRLLTHEHATLKNGARVKFHTGTSEAPASVFLMDADQARAGGECLVQVRMDEPIVAGPGDRFILRTLSPVYTIGGGTVVEAIAGRLKRNRPQILSDLAERAAAARDEKAFAEYCIRRAEALAATNKEISHRAKVPADRLPGLLTALAAEKKIVALADGLFIHAVTLAEATEQLTKALGEHHRAAPESPGLLLDPLLETTGMPRSVMAGLVSRLKAEGRLVERADRLALADHRVQVADKDQTGLDLIEGLYRASQFSPPGESEVAEAAGLPPAEVARLTKILVEHKRLVPVPPDLVFHVDAIELARSRVVAHIKEKGELQSVDFKYLIDTTRKFAIPLLDYLDRIGVTRRIGYTRYLRPPKRGG